MEGEWGWDEYQFNPSQEEPMFVVLMEKDIMA